MSLIWWIVSFSLLGGIFSLVGGIGLLMKKEWVKRHSCSLVSFGAGTLLTISFLDLFPEALEMAERLGLEWRNLFWWPFLAMVGFFFLERFVWFHFHYEPKVKPPTNLMLLIGDSLHNFIDGVVIAASFLVGIPMGIVTALAVLAHEIPQEIADFGIWLKSGVKPQKVLVINVLSSLMTVVGAVLAYSWSDFLGRFQPQLLAFTGGMFVYIATSDLIPELHHEKNRQTAWKQSLAFLGGIGIMYGLIQLTQGWG